VIPAFNRADYIGQAIESVSAQSLGVSELIVVDDGSTDQTAAIAESLGATVLRQENQGVSAARNVGIRSASSPWIAFLDSDDLWEPHKIGRIWAAFQLVPEAAMAFSDYATFDDTGIVHSSVLSRRPGFRTVKRTRVGSGVWSCDSASLARGILPGNFIKPSSLVARRDLLLSVGLFPVGIGHAEDRDLCLRLLTRTNALVIDAVCARYRVHDMRASADQAKMLLGAAAVADRVFTSPNAYPPGSVDFFRRDQPTKLLEAGRLLAEEGRLAEARRHLRRSLRARMSLRGLAVLLATLGGHRSYLALLSLWRLRRLQR
jgi:GT2 family glycosyltransferase